ncbi:MAG: branched-chain amino acid ABC transporter permease [Proteobacteria bacterium]|nr:branched-chain amino acid ABC transporter permease [Pseudomonadota bacterium]MDA1024023.1 branched-chain amino acid ABC transporter permease [Pseudomonadota bacterium]
MMQNKYLLLITLAFVVIIPMFMPPSTSAEMLIFGIIAVSTNIMVGYTGMLSFGQAAYFGIAAYTAGLMLKAGMPLILAAPAGVLLALVTSGIVGYFCVKRTGLYFICLTFAFNQMFYFIAYVWTDVTGGEDGLPGIPRPDFLNDDITFYVFTAVVFFACMIAMLKIVNSPLGLVFKLIRENPNRAEAIGYNIQLFKWFSFVIASSFTGVAGTIYAMVYSIVPIDQIHWLKSGDIIFMLLFGGSGSFFGPLIGAAAYIWMSDTFSVIWARWPLMMGVVFVFVVLFMRGGMAELISNIYNRFKKPNGDPEQPDDTSTDKPVEVRS